MGNVRIDLNIRMQLTDTGTRITLSIFSSSSSYHHAVLIRLYTLMSECFKGEAYTSDFARGTFWIVNTTCTVLIISTLKARSLTRHTPYSTWNYSNYLYSPSSIMTRAKDPTQQIVLSISQRGGLPGMFNNGFPDGSHHSKPAEDEFLANQKVAYSAATARRTDFQGLFSIRAMLIDSLNRIFGRRFEYPKYREKWFVQGIALFSKF